jgi:hypothetical protein
LKKSQALIDTICERIAQGESLRSICKTDDKAMPGLSTVFTWLAEDAKFQEQYARARETQADVFADELVAIADEDPALIEKDGQGGITVLLDSSAIQRQRLRIDTRKWVASKLKPKKYGDKLDVEHAGQVIVEVRKCA